MIPKSEDLRVYEEETLVYDEGEPFLFDAEKYSTYLFVFPDEQFTVYSVSLEKALGHVEKIKGSDRFSNDKKYAIINLTNSPEWHSASLIQDNRNKLINELHQSFFNI